jgi:hypothetical protein
MAQTEFLEHTKTASRSKIGVEIAEIWNWGWSEHLSLTNRSDETVDLGGWYLLALHERKVFQFPVAYRLKSGESVKLHTGANASLKQNPPADLYWFSEPVWANRGDTALLFDATGREMARFVYHMHADPDLDAEPEKRLVQNSVGGFDAVDVGTSE